MCVLLLSSFVSVVETTYATHCPSGESCGSRTSRKRARSSSFRGRLAVCPERATVNVSTISESRESFFEVIIRLLNRIVTTSNFNAEDGKVYAEVAEETKLCVPPCPLRLRVFSF